jgi:hypothetical protein
MLKQGEVKMTGIRDHSGKYKWKIYEEDLSQNKTML